MAQPAKYTTIAIKQHNNLYGLANVLLLFFFIYLHYEELSAVDFNAQFYSFDFFFLMMLQKKTLKFLYFADALQKRFNLFAHPLL